MIYVIIGYYIGADYVTGWASTIAFICFFGSFQILCIGIIGEYISKIYLETKHRPKYIIEEIIKAGIEEVEISKEMKNNFVDTMEADELISDATFKTQGKIIYITLTFKDEVTLVEAQSKALASLANFEEKYQNFYDFHYTLKGNKTDTSEGFLVMGAKNVNGTGLVWNNNTEIETDSE